MNTLKRFRQRILFPVILVASLIITYSCKKNETVVPPVPPQTEPVFTLDHIFISVGGKDYIQFITRCTSETVKLDTVTITDPGNNRITYEYYSDTSDYQVFCKNEPFTFPEDFPRKSGIWRFTYIGQRYNDNSDFTSIVTDTIAE
jgi:hypothetical protein